MIATRQKRRGKGIFQDVRNKFEKITAGVQKEATDLRNKVVDAGQQVLEKGKEVVEKITSKPTRVSAKVRNFLKKVGDMPIVSAEVLRSPVQSIVQAALNAVSLGSFKKEMKEKPYDDIYHLFLIVTLENGKKVSIEKNAIITIMYAKDRKGERMPVSVPSGLTINKALEKTEQAMGDLFATYSAKNNNCQDFILAFLKSNGMGDEKVYAFVKQDVGSLFGKSDFLRKFTNTVTDIGAKVSTLIEGEGVTKSPVNKMNAWIAHVKDVAAKKGISYREALRSAETKASYKKGEVRAMSPPRHEMMETPMKEKKEKRVRKGKGIPTMESSQAMLAQEEQVRDLAPKMLTEEVVKRPRGRVKTVVRM
jgi:hypothetical protein